MVIQLHICNVCSEALPQKILKMLQFGTFRIHLLNFPGNNFQEYISSLTSKELKVMFPKV